MTIADLQQRDAQEAASEAKASGLRFAPFAIHASAPERPGPKGGKRDQNRKVKVDGLCEAALFLFLEKGIESTTIDEITQNAGTAKGSFYRYFDDKTAIVETIFAPTYHAMKNAMDSTREALLKARTHEELHTAYQTLSDDIGWAISCMPDVILLYLQESRAPAVGARAPVRAVADLVVQKTIELTDAAREHGLLRPFPAVVSARSVIGAVEHLLFAVLSGEEVGNTTDIPAALTSLVLDGLRARDGDVARPTGH